jgi:hypothetical protein
MSKIVKIIDSPRKGKRYRVYLENNEYFDFGLDGGSTYIDHHNKKKRGAYRKRHYSNGTEKYLIDTLTPSPALYSYYILWGNSEDIMKNVDSLNRKMGN